MRVEPSSRVAIDNTHVAPTANRFRHAMAEAADRMHHDQAALDRVIGGRANLSTGDLLLLQHRVYRYSQDVELVTKLADRATQTVRQVLTSQS